MHNSHSDSKTTKMMAAYIKEKPTKNKKKTKKTKNTKEKGGY